MRATISLHHVSKSYDTIGANALDDTSISFAQGEFTAIVGASGSGKSTLLNMISGIDRPTEGEILFNEQPLHTYSEAALTKWRGQYIGVVFQFFQLIPTLTILENTMLPMDFNHQYKSSKRKEIAYSLLKKVGIEEQADKLPSELSGGQQQRAAIARALANNPLFLIADEPTGNLDTANTKSILKLFQSFAKEGTTIIMVTHNIELAHHADRIITLQDGKIAKEETL